MEKLRKALDLARQQRAGGLDAVQPTAPEPVAEPAASNDRVPPEPAARSTASPDAAHYAYTQTKVFRPDDRLLERHRILSPGATSPAADAYRMLRTQVAQRMGEHGWRTIAVCSPRRHEGRSLAAVNLAITLAADPRYSVLLCDLDLRSPSLAALFGFSPAVGVDDVLTAKASVEDCLVHPEGFQRLVLLPARAALGGSSEFLAGRVTRDLVAELRDRYPDRILIFDLPPVLVADDALAFSPNVECALVVVDEGTTRREDVTRCLEILRSTPVVGTLLNRSLSPKASAG
jgi:Mrp family chromosome partitioning ATPase